MTVKPKTDKFLSTLPARGATADASTLTAITIFLSTLPARGATLVVVLDFVVILISIHAPREGSDTLAECWSNLFVLFLSTLPARGATGSNPPGTLSGRRFLSTLPARGATIMTRTLAFGTGFLSTLPARGATRSTIMTPSPSTYFYPRSPRGERLCPVENRAFFVTISIHAPREGSDLMDQEILAL